MRPDTSTTPKTASPAYTRVDGNIENGFLLICDHASNHIPPEYERLGLPEEELGRHIAYDIGAAGVTRHLAKRLGVPAILGNFSRLLIDPNRGDDDPTLIMKLSDGAIIPGNRYVDEAETNYRLRTWYYPYHDAIHETLQTAIRNGTCPALLSIHSFTDRWKDSFRKWNGGVLWDSDPRLPVFLIKKLREKTDYIIGDNEPYSGRLIKDTMHRHGTANGLPHALLEIRQDMIRSAEGQQAWARLLADILMETRTHDTLKNDIFQIKHFPSHTKS